MATSRLPVRGSCSPGNRRRDTWPRERLKTNEKRKRKAVCRLPSSLFPSALFVFLLRRLLRVRGGRRRRGVAFLRGPGLLVRAQVYARVARRGRVPRWLDADQAQEHPGVDDLDPVILGLLDHRLN